jgi:hypothetical protein
MTGYAAFGIEESSTAGSFLGLADTVVESTITVAMPTARIEMPPITARVTSRTELKSIIVLTSPS